MSSSTQCNAISKEIENLVKRSGSCRSFLLPRRCCNFLESTTIIAPLFLSQRWFYSGLDERHVQRLRRSGMTFNKPRGRDTLSSSFQSRIRLRAFTGTNDMYTVSPIHFSTSSCASSQVSGMLECQKEIHGSPIVSTENDFFYSSTVDPWSSTGNAVRLRHAAEGDVRSQKIITARAKEEEVAKRKNDRHIAVVDLLPSTGIHLQVTSSFPISTNSSPDTSISSSRQECEIIPPATHTEMVSSSVSPTSSAVQECSLRDAVNGSTYTTLFKVATLSLPSAVPEANAITHTVSFFPPPIFFPQPHPLYYFSFFEPQTPQKNCSNDKKSTASRFIHQDSSTTPSTSGNSCSFFSSFFSTLKKGCSPLERIQFELPAWSMEDDFSNVGAQKSNSLSLSDNCKESSSGKEKMVTNAQSEHEELCKWSQGRCVEPPAKNSSLPTTLRSDRFHPFSFNLFPAAQRRHLQKNGDAILLPVCWTRSRTNAATSTSKEAVQDESLSEHFYLIPCVEPLIEKPEYGREEAQVEMITAYRNILQECAELQQYEKEEDDPVLDENVDSVIERDCCNADQSKQSESSLFSSSDRIEDPASRIKQRTTSTKRRIDILRVPALCVSPSHRRLEDDDWTQDKETTSLFQHEIGKLNYEALLKGFHRLAPECKEALLNNPNFSVELFVPVPLFNHFVKVFSSEAWEVSSSTLRPARTSLYPGLVPPPSLRAMDGWVGKRPELEAGKAKEGKFLLKGPFYQLDGKPIEAKEVWTEIKVFGSAEEEKERLQNEKQTYLESQSNCTSKK